MSLTDWVKWDKELLNYFDKPNLDVSGVLKAPPITKHYSTIGTAFDYALRFLLSREYQLHQKDHWVAHNSLEYNNGKKRRDYLNDTGTRVFRYTFTDAISIFDLLPDCITLAKLDSIFRSGIDIPDDELFQIDQDDVRDLTNLINLVDITLFKAEGQCLLNPTFGQSSQDIGGADADLVIDDCLIDIKTTKFLTFTKEHFRQLSGYYILNLRENNILGTISKLGIYYSRYGLLFTFLVDKCYFPLCADLARLKADLKKTTWGGEATLLKNITQSQQELWKDIEDSIKQYQQA